MYSIIVVLTILVLALDTEAFIPRLHRPAIRKLCGGTSPVLQRREVSLPALSVNDDGARGESGDLHTSVRFLGRLRRKIGLGLMAAWAAFLKVPRKAVASGGNAIKGWDLYGRVPNDEWLFGNYALTDPNLLKRSFVETVVQELPQVLDNFKRRKRINEISSIVSGLGYFAVVMLAVGLLYRTAMAANLKRSKTEEDMGMGFSASAISKKSNRKGKRIEGMDEGWVDMEEDDDE